MDKNFSFRADYGAYADFHSDLDEYDVIDQSLTFEPQWRNDSFVYSLPIRYHYAIQDSDPDYHRFSISPTITFKIPNINNAVEVYGILACTNDVDNFTDFDEDSHSRGGGVGYVIFAKNRTYFRVLGDYRHIYFDEKVITYEYTPNFSEKRHDSILSLTAEHNIQINNYADFFINYTYIHTNSNVSFYDYDRNIIEAGMSLNF